MKKVFTILGIAFALATGGCGTDASSTSNGESGIFGASRDHFATITWKKGRPNPQIDPSDLPPPKEIIARDIRVGDGPVAHMGDYVSVYYFGVNYKTRKKMFWRWSPEPPFEFELGLSEEGWNRVIDGMRVGGRREYVIPSHLAYRTGAIDYIVDLLAVKPAPEQKRNESREG